MTELMEDPDKFVTVGKFLEPSSAQMAKAMGTEYWNAPGPVFARIRIPRIASVA